METDVVQKGTFEWALAQLRAGKKVRRDNWTANDYLALEDRSIYYYNSSCNPKIDFETGIMSYYPDTKNWTVVKELTFADLSVGDSFKVHLNGIVYTKTDDFVTFNDARFYNATNGFVLYYFTLEQKVIKV
jgi:hypothetical protein